MESEETRVPKALLRIGAAEEQQQLPDGWLEKSHVCAALQGLGGAEQREQALRGLAVWKERFAEVKWKPVMEGLAQIAQEDNLRLQSGHELEPVTPARPSLPISSSSAPVVPLVGQRPRVNTLQRLNTASANLHLSRHAIPPTPRARWDIVSSSPATPLSPTPTGNAFAEGGFWGKLAAQAQTSVPQTPVTAVGAEPWSPIVPQDPEGKAAYVELKRDVDSMALKICASRLSIYSTLSDKGYVHPSMVKPKDELYGAEFTLHSRQLKPQMQLDTELPKKMERFAEEEAAAVQQYSIKNTFELLDIDTWLQVDEKTLEMTTLLDAQRDLLRMNHRRRKSKELKLSDQALQLAWAVKILDDTERMVEIEGDSLSVDSDEDQGYDYSNFLRSIKREVSGDLESIVEENPIGSPRSSATTATTSSDVITRSRETSVSQRMSPSPAIPHSLALRFRAGSPSSNNNSDCGLKRTSHATGKRRNLSISTTLVEQQEEDYDDDDADNPTPAAVSPEDKGFRHQGPSFTDLTNWAHELKKMEAKRAELREKRNSVASSLKDVHPALRDLNLQHSRGDSSASVVSWKCETAARREREVAESMAEIHATSTSDAAPAPQLLEIPPTPTTPTRRSPVRSKSFYERERFTGLIPLPPSFSEMHSRQTSTSQEQVTSTNTESTSPSRSLSPQRHRRENSKSSLHDTVRRHQHIRSKSSLSVSKDDEEDWTEELKRMESREKVRQIGEREILNRSRNRSGTGAEDGGEDVGEIGVARSE